MLKHRLIPSATFWLDARNFILVFYIGTVQGFQNVIEIQANNVISTKQRERLICPERAETTVQKPTLNPISPDSLCYPLPANHHCSFYRQALEWMTMNLLLYALESSRLNSSEVRTNFIMSTHREISKEDILYWTCPELLHLSFPSSHQGVCSLYHSPFMKVFWTTSLALLSLQLLVVYVCYSSVNHCTQLKRT